MNIDQIFSLSEFGLSYERLRMEAASYNISIANMAQGENTSVRPLRIAADFSAQLNGPGKASTQEGGFKLVNDPAHPMADKNGNVRYPDVNLADEMTSLMTATRGYEANVRAVNALREMMIKALEIGGRR